MSLSRDQILAKQDDLPAADVPVPEWGDGATIRVRGLTAQARFDWGIARDKAMAGEAAPEPTSYLIALAAVDDAGNPLFQGQDADAIASLRSDITERLAGKILELSGIGEAAAEAAAGNSGATTSGASPTSSPATSDAPSPS